MKRREFITLVGGAAVSVPFPVRAQQAGKLRTIGFLGAGTASAWSPWKSAFVQRLGELGWIEGRNLAIEVRWAEGRNERFAEISAEFVRLKVDIIVTSGAAAQAAKRATSTIPIVFVLASDPVDTGLVASLSRPGGNLTGLSNQSRDLVGKRLDLLREIIPGLQRFAILINVDAANGGAEMEALQAASRALGLEIVTLAIRRDEEIATVIETLKGRADALYVVQDPLLIANRIGISTSALGARLPTIHPAREFVQAGGLMSYGTNFPESFRRAADYADKILRGARPGDLPVEQPTKFEFVINLKTAKALGLTVPTTLLATAHEVIE
jgi:putative tryptophan/tyrosine transport system substrate-binding protein